MAHHETGGWGVYVGTTPEQTDTCLQLIQDEIDAVLSEGISGEELERAQGSLRGGLALSMEDPNSRMVRLGRDEISGSPHLSIDERIARLEAVTIDSVQEVAEAVYSGARVMGVVGPLEPGEFDRWVK
jgi:predicted Zn-dependent peptidase